MRPSAPDKKSFSTASCPILACSSLTSDSSPLRFLPVANTSGASSSSFFFQQLLLPLRDLVGVHAEPFSQLHQRLLAFYRLQRHLGFERGAMVFLGLFVILLLLSLTLF